MTRMTSMPKPITERDWKLSGDGRSSDAQRRLLNAACGDLSAQIIWHGFRLSKDDFRHMLAGTVLKWRLMPGIDLGEGPSLITLGGSSLDLSRSECTDTITLAFHLGDHPEEQRLRCKPVRWCHVVRGARGISDADEEIARRFCA